MVETSQPRIINKHLVITFAAQGYHHQSFSMYNLKMLMTQGELMKYLLLLSLSISTYANTDLFCKVKGDGTTHYKTKKSHYIFKGRKLYKFENEMTTLLPSKYPIKAVKEYNDKIYILTGEHIFVRHLSDLSFDFAFNTSLTQLNKRHEEAQDLAIVNGVIYVAHGSKGVVKIDPMSGSILDQRTFDLPHDTGHISTATGISSVNNLLYVMMDNVTYNFSTKKRAFEGLVILNESLNQEKVISIRQSREALHYPKSFATNEFLISRNLHNLYFYDMKKMNKARSLWPKRRLYNFDGLMLASNPAFYNNEVSGCFSKYVNGKSVYFYRKFKL